MSSRTVAKDLIVLAADTQMQRTIETILEHRRSSLAIASDFSADVLSHPNHDPGCRTDAGRVLEPRRNTYQKAIVIFDYHGCGERRLDAVELENRLETQFSQGGWTHDQITFIVLDPELEAWLFGASFHHIERVVGWSQPQNIREWLIERGFLLPEITKPHDPKAAFEAVLHQQKIPPSAKLFADLAQRASLARCQDRAFQKFRTTLQRWFPAE